MLRNLAKLDNLGQSGTAEADGMFIPSIIGNGKNINISELADDGGSSCDYQHISDLPTPPAPRKNSITLELSPQELARINERFHNLEVILQDIPPKMSQKFAKLVGETEYELKKLEQRMDEQEMSTSEMKGVAKALIACLEKTLVSGYIRTAWISLFLGIVLAKCLTFSLPN